MLAGVQSSASYTIALDDYRVPFQKRRLVGVPEGLFQYYNSENLSQSSEHCPIYP
jgi:nuclear pore complex protein Nup155